MRLLHAFLACMLTAVLAAAHAQTPGFVPVPSLQQRVTDQIGMLGPQQRSSLENVLQEYEQRTGSQIAVLLISKTEPEAIEQYSIRVFDEWKLGRKDVDDGVLLIVARDNPPSLRRLRIEAGRGVQGVLTDAQSKRILQDVIAPHFRQNDYYGGLVAAVSAITALLDQEKFPSADKKAAQAQDEGFGWLPLLLFIGCVILFNVMARSRRHTRYGNDWGNAAGIVLGNELGRRWGRGDFRGGFGDGGFGGGGFGGGGGGFSGGGGSADGGGASGNW